MIPEPGVAGSIPAGGTKRCHYHNVSPVYEPLLMSGRLPDRSPAGRCVRTTGPRTSKKPDARRGGLRGIVCNPQQTSRGFVAFPLVIDIDAVVANDAKGPRQVADAGKDDDASFTNGSSMSSDNPS